MVRKIYPVRNKPPQAAAAVPEAGRISNGVYFDYAASTPVAPEVLKTMQPYFLPPPGGKYGNPGSLHSFGQEALAVVDKSRETIAKTIGAPPAGGFREIIFTGSATEANNLALRGVASYWSNKSNQSYRIIVSAIEHESVLETARDLEKKGAEVVYLPVKSNGVVDLAKLKKALNEETILVSVMFANNEIGTIQPIAEIAEIVRSYKSNRSNKIYPLLHTDAVQAFQFLDCNVNPPPGGLGVDLMTLSAHKIYGPKGIGALYVKPISPISPIGPISPIVTGGGQEFGLRSGTENTAAIAGFAAAVELVSKDREKEKKRMSEIRSYFWEGLKEIYPAARLNPEGDSNALPNILNVYFPGFSSQELLVKFDLAGIAVSSGSACSARSSKPSHVLQAVGLSTDRIMASIRFSFGRFTAISEIKSALKISEKILKS